MKFSIKTEGTTKETKPSVLDAMRLVDEDAEFKPTELTFTLETNEDATHFHDNVLPVLLGKGKHDLWAALFYVCLGAAVNSSGKV